MVDGDELALRMFPTFYDARTALRRDELILLFDDCESHEGEPELLSSLVHMYMVDLIDPVESIDEQFDFTFLFYQIRDDVRGLLNQLFEPGM